MDERLNYWEDNSPFFDILIVTLSKALMLKMGLCLPVINTKMAQDVLNLLTNFQLGSITTQLHCTSFPDHIPKCIDKLLVSGHTKIITVFGFQTHENLCRDRSIVYGHNIWVYCISCYCFIHSPNIECQKWCPMGMLKGIEYNSSKKGKCVMTTESTEDCESENKNTEVENNKKVSLDNVTNVG